MSINIYCDADVNNPFDTVTNLGEDVWDLPDLIDELENWLKSNLHVLVKGSYVADIGFSVRENATGGGAVLSKQMISMLHQIGMEVYFSEYN